MILYERCRFFQWNRGVSFRIMQCKIPYNPTKINLHFAESNQNHKTKLKQPYQTFQVCSKSKRGIKGNLEVLDVICLITMSWSSKKGSVGYYGKSYFLKCVFFCKYIIKIIQKHFKKSFKTK